MTNRNTARVWLIALLAAGCTIGPVSSVIALNPSITHQTMVGWEAAILSTVLDYESYKTPAFDRMLDQMVDDIGVTRFQLGVYPGMEHTRDSAPGYLNRTISENTWARQYLYQSVNDNDDSNVMNANGFHWTILDWQIDNLVLAIKRRIEARGEPLYTYASFTDYGSSTFEHWRNPAEYAEFMLALFDHMRDKYGFVPDGINVINEPGYNNDWTPGAIGRVVAATGARLAAAGYHPDFLAPSTIDMGQAAPFFDEIAAVPGATQYLKEISYHRYRQTGGLDGLRSIADRARQHGMRTLMNEYWKDANTYVTLHEDLKIGGNSTWQQAALGGYYTLNQSTGQAVMTPKTTFMRQYYKYIRPGAVRIEATTSHAALDPLAFINKDGKYVTVIKATSAGRFAVTNLPPGLYGIVYTTAKAADVSLPDVTLSEGQTLEGSIPAAGAVTVFDKSPPRAAATR